MAEIIEDKNKSCRNCLNRFSCDEGNLCDKYEFDDEAATCDDCSKKDDCPNYVKNKVTCTDWEPITTCDECTKQETCPNFMEGGRICDDFQEIRYRLTEKGCLYLAMEQVNTIDNMYVGTEILFEDGFFEELDHEVRLNGLIVNRPDGIVGKTCEFVKNLFKKKPEKTMKDLFFEVAHKNKFFREFGLSDKIVEATYNRFVEILTHQYEN